MQAARGRAALEAVDLDAQDPESWHFMDEHMTWTGSEALFVFGAVCGGLGQSLAPLWLLPKGLRAALDRMIARNRCRLSDRSDRRAILDPALQARLLS